MTTTTARSIVREIVPRFYRRHTPTNGHAPEGAEYGVRPAVRPSR
ncbi:hypothetical protein AB0C86_19655 [Streptomyces lavendulae]